MLIRKENKIYRRSCKFESNRNELTREDIIGMVKDAFSAYSYSAEIDGTSAYLSTYDRFGSEMSYQGYITLVKVTKDALFFNTVYPSELTLDKVTDIDKFNPAGASMDELKEALDEATSYRDNGYLDEDIAYSMSEHGYVENLDIPFKDLFDEVTYEDIKLDENGKPIITSDDELKIVSEIAVNYLKHEFESYDEDVSTKAENIISDLNSKFDVIIEDLEDTLEETKESLTRNKKEARFTVKSLRRKMESNLNISDLEKIVCSLPKYPGINVKVTPSSNPGTRDLSLEIEITKSNRRLHHSFNEDETEESIREELIDLLDHISTNK